MTKSEFNKAEIDWAKAILSAPDYKMPNGRSAHTVAYEVMSKACDRRLETGLISAYGEWA